MYKRVMAVDVFLWGRHVGRIAPDFGSYYQFQYDPDFVRSGVQIAPICMPLRDEIYKVVNFDLPKGAFSGLPGVFADSLPDGWNRLLVDRMLLGNSDITLTIALVVSITLVVVVFVAKVIGCVLPLVADKIGFDPAVMANPFITTIVDALALLVYFVIASSILPM